MVDVERSGVGIEPLLDRGATAIAAITLAELLYGVHRAGSPARRARREHFVERLVEAFDVLPFGAAEARRYALVWAELEARGQKLSAHDLQITATALARDWPLLTADVRHFGRIDGLEVVAPSA